MNSNHSYPDSENGPRAFAAVWRVWWRASAALLILGLLVIVCSPKQFLASVQLKMEFVGTNGVALNPEDYAASGYGWSPLTTEARTVCSDLFLSRAQELGKLKTPGTAPLAISRDQLGYGYIPIGIKLLVVGEERNATEQLADALAQVYRDCRHQLLPAPPGCQALRVSIAQPARGSSSLMYADRLLKAVLVALFLGLAVAVFVRRKPSQSESTLLPNFLCFLGVLYSAGLLFTPLEFTVLLVGAAFLAFVLASAIATVDIVAGLNPPLPRSFLKFISLAICVLWIATVISVLFQNPDRLGTESRVRISLEQPNREGELPLSYDPRFVETECALICSGQFLDQFIDRWQLQAALKSAWGSSLVSEPLMCRGFCLAALRQRQFVRLVW